MRYFTLLLFIGFSIPSFGQNKKVLTQLDQKYQNCLNSENNMLPCSQKYYSEIDSLLNVAYKNYRASLNNETKNLLKNEQLKWFATRDVFFKKLDNDYSKKSKAGYAGKDARMIVIDEKAQFVRKRVNYFIEKLHKS